jgi:3',5'-cyclic AMP phosphodiesterase CpdA
VKILHFSDIHIQVDNKTPLWRMGWRRAMHQFEFSFLGRARKFERARQTVQRIIADAERLDVDHAVLSGDLTALGMPEEFRLAREALGSLATNGRLTIVPGNHDRLSWRDLRAFEEHFGDLCTSDLPEYQRPGPFPAVRLIGSDLAVVGLDSSRLPPFVGLVYGKVHGEQFDSLKAILADPRMAGRAILVVVHHAPRTRDGGKDLWTQRLFDDEKLLALLPGPRHALLFGHVHDRFWHRATEKTPHLFGAGSSTQAGMTGYWLIETNEGVVTDAQAVTLE